MSIIYSVYVNGVFFATALEKKATKIHINSYTHRIHTHYISCAHIPSSLLSTHIEF